MFKKICALVFFVSIFATLGLFKTTPVSADVLAPGQKGVGVLVKFQGWDMVKDYIIAQPWYPECSINKPMGGTNFHLINDGFDFGFESHGNYYTYPFAISREYTSDISLSSELSDYGNWYSISCTSSAFLNSYPTDAILPHGDEVVIVDESSLVVRKDYIVTFQGVDKQSKKLLMSVSEPILRYDLDSPEAKAFKASLTKNNTLSDIPPLEEKPLVVQVTSTTSLPKNPKPLPILIPEAPLNNSLNTTWKIFSYISLIIFIFVLGLLIGKRKSLAKVNDNVKLPDSN
ncbi:MAG: hypothetical protein V1819_00955 [bacterium]